MRSVDVCDAFRWRRLFVYIRQVHNNVDCKKGRRHTLPQLLRPCAWVAEDDVSPSSASSSPEWWAEGDSPSFPGRRRRRRRYRGSLELADNCNVFFWENGRTVQVVRAKDGKILREIDTGQTFRRYFHRLANVKNRLFVCLNDCIKVWEYGINDAHKPPVELPPPTRLPTIAKVGRPLELLVHRRRLILLESNCCLLWDTDTFEFVCCIQHDDPVDVPSEPTLLERSTSTSTSGVLAAAATAAAEATGAAPTTAATAAAAAARGMPPVALAGQAAAAGAAVVGDRSDSEESRALEVQWMGDLIVTWVRPSRCLKVWTLEGQQRAHLRMDNPLVQVDVARVTWVSVKILDHFILAALDARSVVSLWDSKRNFNPIFRFYCGCEEPFDLVLTQDFMAVVNDNMAENRLELCFWKLWLHPNFEEVLGTQSERDVAEAARLRMATVQQGGHPAGLRFSAVGGNAGGAGQTSSEQLQRLLHQELRPNARPIKNFSIPDIDSYFASYRNFLNVCSFHKSGQESLSVYRSSSLQKKIFFPPAKHTKFEEWLALQVQNDGTVVLHDFRPNQLAFDEICPDDARHLETVAKIENCTDSTESSRRRSDAQHARLCFGSRSRGR